MILFMLACRPPDAAATVRRPAIEPVSEQPEPVWPAQGSPLTELPLSAPRNLRRTVVYLMAGHHNGRSRTGNLGVHGQIEAEVNLWTVEQLAERLEATNRFEVVVGRREGEYPSYGARIRHAQRSGADVFIELHTDARGTLVPWADVPDGRTAYRSWGDTGFSVLYNESGELGVERRDLARHLGEQLAAVGLPPFWGYADLYENDPVEGVFIDRRGLMMLRRPAMPSVIIETHNAKDFEESLRWREEETLDAFASAVAEALLRYRQR